MSGRWLIAILLLLCASMVLWALWQRSLDTGHVRQFWGAAGAACIQRAAEVKLLRTQDGTAGQQAVWQDISQAPGLIHLRATLVDDRYFHWPAQPLAPSASSTSIGAAEPSSAHYELLFNDGVQRVQVALDLATGQVTNVSTHQSVRLIESSRQALATYFQLPELASSPP